MAIIAIKDGPSKDTAIDNQSIDMFNTSFDIDMIVSRESDNAAFDTFFHDFNLTCQPSLNFWTSDELTNDKDEVGNRKIEELPRYISINWTPAPDLAPETRVKKINVDSDMGGSKTTEKVNGVQFTPEHLNNFEIPLKSLANGYISPGTLHAVVDIPKNSSGLSDQTKTYVNFADIDENLFLEHPDTVGVSINELITQLHTRDNSLRKIAKISATPMSSIGTVKNTVAAGKYSFTNNKLGSACIQGIAAGTVSLKCSTGMGTRPDAKKPSHVDQILQKVSFDIPPSQDASPNSARVAFISPAIGGSVSDARAKLADAPEHTESILALAQMLSNLEVLDASTLKSERRKIDIPQFASFRNLPPVEYIGYLLEKYEMTDSGAFELVESIRFPKREYSGYVDTKIKYGKIYRYRIRCILRWTRPDGMNVDGHVDVVAGDNFQKSSPDASSYFHSEWGTGWAYAAVIDTTPPPPPDELVVRPESSRVRICVSFKFPLNTQLDICTMRLFRKMQDENGDDISEWQIVGSDWRPENVLFHDYNVDFFQNSKVSYVYAAQCVDRHGEVSALSDQLSAKLNSDYAVFGEYSVKFISQEGVALHDHGVFSTNPVRKFFTNVIVQNGNIISLLGRNTESKMAMEDRDYIVRLESLDTGETVDLLSHIVYTNLEPEIKLSTLKLGSYIRTDNVSKNNDMLTKTAEKRNYNSKENDIDRVNVNTIGAKLSLQPISRK